MRRVAPLAAILALFFVIPSLAYAQEGTIVIEVGGVATGNEGDVIEVAREPVPADLVGATCDGFLEIENNNSVHPNNDLIIDTGTEVVEIPNYESEAGVIIDLEGTVTVGEEIVLSVRLGRQGITSGGAALTLDCVQQTTTTTTAPPETTTTAPETTTTAPETTTTAPPPGGGVETGAGGTAGADQSALPFLGATALFAAIAAGLWAWRGRTDS